MPCIWKPNKKKKTTKEGKEKLGQDEDEKEKKEEKDRYVGLHGMADLPTCRCYMHAVASSSISN